MQKLIICNINTNCGKLFQLTIILASSSESEFEFFSFDFRVWKLIFEFRIYISFSNLELEFSFRSGDPLRGTNSFRSKRLGVLQSKLHFLTQFFTALMNFDARTTINALPKPLSIFLKISTTPQTICFTNPNAPNWHTHCSSAYKIIDFE